MIYGGWVVRWGALLGICLLVSTGQAHEIKSRTLTKSGFPAPTQQPLSADDYDNALFGLAAGAVSQTATQTLAASGQVDCSAAGLIPVAGSGGPVTLISNPQILAPVDLPNTKRCILKGTSDTNTVTLSTGNGVVLDGTVTLGANDLLELLYDGTTWIGVALGGVASGAAFPTAPRAYQLFLSTDDSAANTCDSGGGTAVSLCYWDAVGAEWVPLGGGGSGTQDFNAVMSQGRVYGNANAEASALEITRDSAAAACSGEAGWKFWVSAANIPTQLACDASGNELGQILNAPAAGTTGFTKAGDTCWSLSGSTGKMTLTNATAGCGTITGNVIVEAGSTLTAGLPIITKSTATSYTVGTTDARESYGGVIYVTGAATITLPAIVAGMSVKVITIGAVAVSVDPNVVDRILLDGTALADGIKATNTSTTGDMLVCLYESSAGWYCASSSNDGDPWTNGGA